MKSIRWLTALTIVATVMPSVHAQGWRKDSGELAKLNSHILGKVIDHTANHGIDRRINSRALGQKRDLYVYTPPGYSAKFRYPVILFMHGFYQDEQTFLRLVPYLDEAICQKKLPPVIVAAADGSITGEPSHHHAGSCFLNTEAGDFEKFLLEDVWDFLCHHYPLRWEREAHFLAGVSMGGFSAFNLGIRHRYAFGTVIGIHPPVNIRWVDSNQNHHANFDPRFWGWRASVDTHESVARYFGGTHKVRMGDVVYPLFGDGADAINEVAHNNPIELVDCCRLRPGELQMYIGYGGKDQLNIDAQVESFLYMAKFRGLSVGVGYIPNGRHDTATAQELWPSVVEWLSPRLHAVGPVDRTQLGE